MAVELHVANELVGALKPYMHLLNVVEAGRRVDAERNVTVISASAPSAPKGAVLMNPTFARHGDRVLLQSIEWLDARGEIIQSSGATGTAESRRW